MITGSIENFVGSGDFAKFFTALFDNAESVAAEKFVGTLVREFEDNFSKFVVDFDANSGRTYSASDFLGNGDSAKRTSEKVGNKEVTGMLRF